MIRVAAVACALLLSFSAAAETGAAPRNLLLEEGKRQIERGRPEAAVDELRRALEMPGVPESQRVEILSWLGAALYLSRDEIEAERVWETRVRMDPRSPPPLELDQEVIDAFDRVRDRTVIISHTPPSEVFAGSPVGLDASLVDRMDRTADLLVYTRRAGEPGFQVTTFRLADGGWRADIVPPPLAGSATQYELEYYLVAQAETGEVLHSLGDAGTPLKVTAVRGQEPAEREARYAVLTAPSQAVTAVEPSDDPGKRSRAWIWGTILGACIIAAAGSAYILLQGDSTADLPATSLGTISFPLDRGEDGI